MNPEVGGVAPVKYSVGLRPPSVFDAPLRIVRRHLVCVLQARCLRVTCRITSMLGEYRAKSTIIYRGILGTAGISEC